MVNDGLAALGLEEPWKEREATAFEEADRRVDVLEPRLGRARRVAAK